jgi:hypothetical protein
VPAGASAQEEDQLVGQAIERQPSLEESLALPAALVLWEAGPCKSAAFSLQQALQQAWAEPWAVAHSRSWGQPG